MPHPNPHRFRPWHIMLFETPPPRNQPSLRHPLSQRGCTRAAPLHPSRESVSAQFPPPRAGRHSTPKQPRGFVQIVVAMEWLDMKLIPARRQGRNMLPG